MAPKYFFPWKQKSPAVAATAGEAILNAPEALGILKADDLVLTDDMTASEQRAAVRYAVERLANGAETTAVNDNPAEHTAAEQRVIEDYKNAVDNRLLDWLRGVKQTLQGGDSNAAQKKLVLNPVSQKTADAIQSEMEYISTALYSASVSNAGLFL